MAKRKFTHSDLINVRDTPVAYPQIAGLSRTESELIHLYRSCEGVGKRKLVGLARLFASPNDATGNVIDFAAYRREHGYAE